MPQQGFVFPELPAATDQRPARCPSCDRVGMSWHRGYTRPVVAPSLPDDVVNRVNAPLAKVAAGLRLDRRG